ncbi:hypothetical protein [Galbibacter sp. PAP.153]|uniref:hypothetical protein n=1 Tax=Galbibacter sp. PAP.153 TaxID=3104623 RepID=UPI0030085DB2
MKKINQIKGAESIFTNNKVVFIRGENEILASNIIFVKNEFQLFKSTYFIYRYKDEELEVFNINTNSFDKYFENSNQIIGSLKNSKEFLLVEKTSNTLHKVVDFKNKFSFDFNKGISIFYDDMLISTSGISYTKKNKIEVFSIDSINAPLWHYKLPEDFTIFGPPQVIEDVLFFKATKEVNRYKKVIGLNIKTGEVKWEQSYQIPYHENNITSLINPENNLCYGYGESQYQIFNPLTGVIVFEKDMSEYYAKGIAPNVYRNAIFNNKLWFVSGRGENAKFGALNIATSEIDFVQDAPLENDEQFETPVYHDGKLYLLDTGKTLHIYEDTHNNIN